MAYIDEVVEKNKRYLTNAQVNALVAASKEYNIRNAGNRAGALASAREQYDAGYRGLQNMGLAGSVSGPATSGEVPRLKAQVSAPFEDYNRRLRDVENRRLSALGGQFAVQTQEEEARIAAEREEAARRAAAVVSKIQTMKNDKSSVARVINNNRPSGAKGITSEDLNTIKRYDEPYTEPEKPATRAQTVQNTLAEGVNQAFMANAQVIAAAKVLGISSPANKVVNKVTNALSPILNQKTGVAHTDDERDIAKSIVQTTKSNLSKGFDMDQAQKDLEAAQKKVDALASVRDTSARPGTEDAYQKAVQQRDVAKLKVEDPKTYSYMVVANSNADPATKRMVGTKFINEKFTDDANDAAMKYKTAQDTVNRMEAEYNKSKPEGPELSKVNDAIEIYYSAVKAYEDTAGHGAPSAASREPINKANKILNDLGFTSIYKAEEYRDSLKNTEEPEGLTKARDNLAAAELRYKDPDTYRALQMLPYKDLLKQTNPDVIKQAEEKVADYQLKSMGIKVPGMNDSAYTAEEENIPGLRKAYNNWKMSEGDAAEWNYEKELKDKYGVTPSEAKKRLDAFYTEKDNRLEYSYYKDGMVALLDHSGEKPTKPVNTEETDTIYRRVNGLSNIIMAASEYEGAEFDTAAKYMTQEQKDAYNAIYERDGVEAADQYFKDITPFLNIQRVMQDEAYYRQYADEHPLLADLRSVGASLLYNVPAAIDRLAHGAVSLFTDTYYDPNSELSYRSGRADVIRSERSQNILSNMSRPEWVNNVLNFAYQIGMSMADSGVAMAFAYAGAPWMVDALFFSSAGNSAYKEAKERGATQAQAMEIGILAGAAEAIFEHASIEHFMRMDYKGKGALVKNLLSQATAEGSEEVFTEIANILTDVWVMRDKSQYAQAVKDYKSQGMSDEQAQNRAFMDQLASIGMAGFGGAVPGALFGLGGAAVSSVKFNKEGKRLNSNTQAKERVIQLAEIMGGKAQESLDVYNADKTDRNLGELSATVQQNMLDMFGKEKEPPDVSKDTALEMNAGSGKQVDLDAAVRGQIIDKATAYSAMLSGDRMSTATAKAIMDVLGKELLNDMGYNTSSSQKFASSYNQRLDQYGIQSRADAMAGFSFRQRGSYLSPMQRTPSVMGAVRAGSALTQAQERYTTTKDKADQVTRTEEATTRVWKDPNLGYVEREDGKLVRGLPGNMTSVPYEEQKKNKFAARITAKAGRATYAIAGMEALEGLSNEQKISELKKNMTKEALGKAEFLEQLAPAMKLDMVIHDDLGAADGYVDDNGVLHISLSSKKSILRVTSHELLHEIRRVSEEHYQAIKDAIIEQVGQEEFDKKVAQKAEEYRKAGVTLSQNGAEEETIAEYSERMLSDTDWLEDFVEKNPDAARTLGDVLLKIINAIKKAFKRIENRNYGTSWSQEIEYTQDTLQAMYDGLEAVMARKETKAEVSTDRRIANETKATERATEQAAQAEADELYRSADDIRAEEAKKAAEESAKKKTYVPGFKAAEVERVMEAGVFGDKSNYEGDDYEQARAMIAQLIPDMVSLLKKEGDIDAVVEKTKAAVGKMLDNYFEDDGDMAALREAIPSVIGVDSTAKGDLKAQDQSLFQMSAKLSKALGHPVTLVSEQNAKGQKNAKYSSAEKLEEVWERVRDQFGLSDDQDFSIDTTKLLDFIEQQADTRKTFNDLYGKQRQEIITSTAVDILQAVKDMYSEKTGQRFSLDVDRLRNNNVRNSLDADYTRNGSDMGESGIEDDVNRAWAEAAVEEIDRMLGIESKKTVETKPAAKGSSNVDSKGNALSEQQVEYFKDSKVRDKQGRLRPVYHWTYGQFTEFRPMEASVGSRRTHGDGYYFSTDAEEYRSFGRFRMDMYANVTNPFEMELTPKQAIAVYDKYAAPFHTNDRFGTYREHALNALQSSYKVFDYLKEYAEQNGIGTSDILRDLGFDGVHDGIEWVAFDSNQFKFMDNTNPTKAGDLRFDLDTDYLRLAEKYKSGTATEAETQQLRQAVEQAGKEAGYTIRAYHGTGRADRVGTVFRADRATSGPMAFFTSDKSIADNYARDKQDTSIAYDTEYDSYETQFRAKTKKGQNNPVNVRLASAWGYVPFAERAEIRKKAGQLRRDYDGDYENLMLDPENNSGLGGFAYHLQEAKGNVFRALIEEWLNSGDLFDDEAKFLEVLDKVGATEALRKVGLNIEYMDPNYREEKTYDTLLKIERPFNTQEVNERFVMNFEKWAAKQPAWKYAKESVGADFWDKNAVTAEEFAERLRSDTEKGYTHAWTSIPDIMTDYLKHLNRDGIIDKGGKNGGVEHTVYIPFSSEQIKSADPVTYDDQGNVIPLSERFNQEKEDIRWSLDTDAARQARQAFTVIDTAGIEDGLEALKNVKNVGAFAMKDISRFLDAISHSSKDEEANKNLRNTLSAIFEKPHSEATGRYARGVERMQQRVLDIGVKAGVCDEKGGHFDSKKSAAIQNIGEGFSNTYTDLKLKVKDADRVTVRAYEPGTDKLVVSEKDYTLKELRQAYGTNVADFVWGRVFDETQKAQASGKEAGWLDETVNTRPYTLADLQDAFPRDWQQLKTAADEFRQMYDEYIRDQNNMLRTIYPIASEYESVEKVEKAISKKQERLARHKVGVEQQIQNLQKSLEDKEKEMAGKKRTDTKAFRNLVEQANRITDKIAAVKAEIAEYEANINEELAVMNAEKAQMQNAVQSGESLKRMHRLQYRSDYFHHFQEMASGVQNLKAIFTNNTDISPAIVGRSENTKAKSRWAGYYQQRMGADYTADAMNGMLRYGQLAEYKLAFDPLVSYLRNVTEQIRTLDDNTNRDGLIKYLMAWTDNIAGKSHRLDRLISDAGMAPRKAMQVLNWINSRVIQNTLLFNMRSSLIQISNITNAKGIVTNNLDWFNGLRCWAAASKGNEAMQAIMAQSNFLASRYMDNMELTDSALKSAKKFAGWMLGALDEVSAKATWWAAYTQYTRNPNAKVIQNAYRTYDNAIDYADDVTRRTHAGRGVGELAPAMTSRVINFVAPFQVEINNTFELFKDNVKRGNYLGLLSTGLSVFLFNTIFEAIVGSSPLQFDFIRAVLDIVLGFKNDDPDEDDDDYGLLQAWQRIAGEGIGSLPFAGQLVSIIGEDTAKKIFGEDNDATRYGNTQIGVSAVMNAGKGLYDIGKNLIEGKNVKQVNWISDLDDLVNLTLPMGGKQLTRSIQGLYTVAQGYGGKNDKEGKEQVQFVTDQDILHYIHGGLFGKWSLTEASEYFGEERLLPKLFGEYEGPKSSIGKPVDANEYKAALAAGIDGKGYFSLKYDLKEYTTQAGKRSEMMEQSFTPEQKAKLDALLFGSKDAEMKAEGAVVYQKSGDEWKVKADYTNQDMFDLSQAGDKTYTGTLEAMEKTGLPQDQAVLVSNMWDQAKKADDSKTEFRNMLRDNKNLTVAQKEALDLQYCGNKYAADYSDPELYELSITNRTTYEKAKQAKANGIPVKNYVSLLDKKNDYSGEDKADYMRREIMNGNLTEKQKELLDDLLVSDKGRNPDYSSPAWFEISMLGGGQYNEAKEGAKIGLKPETYLTVYGKWKTLDAKDENGKTVNGLKKKRAKEYLDSLTITAPEYDYIWTVIFGYKK